MQGLMRGEESRDRCLIREIAFVEDEMWMLTQLCEAIFFQLHIIIAVEAVKADDMTACFQQAARNMKADKARCTRHQNGALLQAGDGFFACHFKLGSAQSTGSAGARPLSVLDSINRDGALDE